MATRVLTELRDITRQRLDTAADAPLDAGEARLAVRRFALTANNVTYAATGDRLGYWRFYPGGVEGTGIVPVWGVAEVIESRSEALAEGDALYGFLPMAERFVIRPEAVSERTVVDRSPHRAELPAVYNALVRLAPGRSAREDHLRALLQPLIATSWLLADWLAENGHFGAEQVVIGSASSKTGLGLARFLTDAGAVEVVGLTSERHRGFVEGLGCYDSVRSYEDVGGLARRPTVYVDMSGVTEVKRRLHGHLGDDVVRSVSVGMSHWDAFEDAGPMPGAKPEFFFAPAQIARRRADWGPGVVEARIEDGLARVAEDAEDWMQIVRHDGLAGAMEAYAALARGRAAPGEGHVVEMGGRG